MTLSTMAILRALTILIWAAVILYMTPAAWAMVRNRPRRSDPSRLAWFCIALVQVLGTVRWFIAPDNEELWQAIYVLLIGVGVYVLKVHHSYGRGPPV